MNVDPARIRISRDGNTWTARYGTLSVSYRLEDIRVFRLGSMDDSWVLDLARDEFESLVADMSAHERLELAAAIEGDA